MSTYGTAGVSYGEPFGTYGDLESTSESVPTPTYATGAVGGTALAGASARTGVSGASGRSTVTGPAGTTLTTGHTRARSRDRIG